MKTERMLAIALGALVLAAPGVALAHDFWMQPERFRMPGPDSVAVRLWVGAPGDVKEIERRPHRIVRFVARGAGEPVAVEGEKGEKPAGRVRLERRGVYALGYQGTASYVELSAKKFEAYLREEGLDSIIEERRRRRESRVMGRESYSRSAKALVRVGAGAGGFDRKLGLPLEITPTEDPFALRRSGCVPFAVELGGRPLAGATVRLVRVADLGESQRATTDEAGIACLRIPEAGVWMVAAIHMRRAPRGVRGDWESTWATLTFEAGG